MVAESCSGDVRWWRSLDLVVLVGGGVLIGCCEIVVESNDGGVRLWWRLALVV